MSMCMWLLYAALGVLVDVAETVLCSEDHTLKETQQRYTCVYRHVTWPFFYVFYSVGSGFKLLSWWCWLLLGRLKEQVLCVSLMLWSRLLSWHCSCWMFLRLSSKGYDNYVFHAIQDGIIMMSWFNLLYRRSSLLNHFWVHCWAWPHLLTRRERR